MFFFVTDSTFFTFRTPDNSRMVDPHMFLYGSPLPPIETSIVSTLSIILALEPRQGKQSFHMFPLFTNKSKLENEVQRLT